MTDAPQVPSLAVGGPTSSWWKPAGGSTPRQDGPAGKQVPGGNPPATPVVTIGNQADGSGEWAGTWADLGGGAAEHVPLALPPAPKALGPAPKDRAA